LQADELELQVILHRSLSAVPFCKLSAFHRVHNMFSRALQLLEENMQGAPIWSSDDEAVLTERAAATALPVEMTATHADSPKSVSSRDGMLYDFVKNATDDVVVPVKHLSRERSMEKVHAKLPLQRLGVGVTRDYDSPSMATRSLGGCKPKQRAKRFGDDGAHSDDDMPTSHLSRERSHHSRELVDSPQEQMILNLSPRGLGLSGFGSGGAKKGLGFKKTLSNASNASTGGGLELGGGGDGGGGGGGGGGLGLSDGATKPALARAGSLGLGIERENSVKTKPLNPLFAAQNVSSVTVDYSSPRLGGRTLAPGGTTNAQSDKSKGVPSRRSSKGLSDEMLHALNVSATSTSTSAAPLPMTSHPNLSVSTVDVDAEREERKKMKAKRRKARDAQLAASPMARKACLSLLEITRNMDDQKGSDTDGEAPVRRVAPLSSKAKMTSTPTHQSTARSPSTITSRVHLGIVSSPTNSFSHAFRVEDDDEANAEKETELGAAHRELRLLIERALRALPFATDESMSKLKESFTTGLKELEKCRS
jgi:hypothetical protein